MTESQIETLLRRPPRITVPPGLRAQLEADIRLPRANDARSEAVRSIPAEPRFNAWLKRWIPAFSFGLFVLGCLVVLAMQSNKLSALRREAESLRQNASAVPPEGVAMADLMESLRKDKVAIEKLRSEIAALRHALAQAGELQAQNDTLRDQVRVQRAAILANSDDPFAVPSEKADSLQCISNMKQLGLALRLWANENRDLYPPDFLSITKELNTPKILVCPADKANLPAELSWERFNPSRVSYDYFGAGQKEEFSGHEWVLTRCRIHGHIGFHDGSVQQVAPGRGRILLENGKHKLIWQNVGQSAN